MDNFGAGQVGSGVWRCEYLCATIESRREFEVV